MSFRKIISTRAAALAFAATASVGIAHAATAPQVWPASKSMTEVGAAPQTFADNATVTTPFGTEAWAVGHSAPNEGAIKVQATVMGGVSNFATIAVDGGPEQYIKKGLNLTYWAMPDAGDIRLSFVLDGVHDGALALAVTMKYGETRTVQMFDANGKPIASLRLTASAA